MASNYPRPKIISASAFTRPADTTAYASGDLVANSTTAGSVVPITFAGVVRNTGYRSVIRRAGIQPSQALLANGTFRLHLFTSLPTVTNGDNGALDVPTNLATYLGWFEMVLAIIGTGQGAFGWSSAVATAASDKPAFLSVNSTSLFALLEARAAYVPASAQTFTPYLEIDQY